ncbi:MAG: thymidine phosphorylase [Eubacterium sp.]|nr:thymidine phosphorylase [Eubacterium sp.]
MGYRFVDLIHKKRNGGVLTGEEIRRMVVDYVSGEIPDYQMSSMLMAIYFQGMTDDEVTALTVAMRDSGETVDLSPISGIKVDKHSTGGVGDKTTLIVGPIVAAAGIPVAKMSGRGLGFTGGTYDKLESIPGYRVELNEEEFFASVNAHGIALVGQSGDLAPADKMLYALRDVTATVESIPLIASSIMSKKLAAGADKILLDVTVGNGAFMKDIESATELAKKMVAIGNGAGRETVAMITDMNEPLGLAIGNNLEVKEAVEMLRGGGPEDLKEVCFALAGMMISLGTQGGEGGSAGGEMAGGIDGKSADNIADEGLTYEQGVEKAKELIADGSAYKKFLELVENQGGDVSYIEDPTRFEMASESLEIKAEKDGFISYIDTEGFGMAAGMLGAGREKKEDTIDYSAGIIMQKKYGDAVKAGDVVATLYASDQEKLRTAGAFIQDKYDVRAEKPEPLKLIYEVIK